MKWLNRTPTRKPALLIPAHHSFTKDQADMLANLFDIEFPNHKVIVVAGMNGPPTVIDR